MHKWILKLINTQSPFDEKQAIVEAPSIIEAFDERIHGQAGYYARSARAFFEEVYHHEYVS